MAETGNTTKSQPKWVLICLFMEASTKASIQTQTHTTSQKKEPTQIVTNPEI